MPGSDPDQLPDPPDTELAIRLAGFMRLNLPRECVPGVAATLQVLREHAERVERFPFGPELG